MEVITNFNITSSRDIYNALERIDREFYVPPQTKFEVGHVFDEDKSVRWNREEAVRRNQEIADIKKQAREFRVQSCANLDEAIINYIMTEADYTQHFTRLEALAILRGARYLHNDEWWHYLDEMIEVAIDLYAAREGVDLKSE